MRKCLLPARTYLALALGRMGLISVTIFLIFQIPNIIINNLSEHMQSKEQIMKFLFTTKYINKAQEFLHARPWLDPRGYHDENGNNILHKLSHTDDKDMLKLYINHTAALLHRQLSKSNLKQDVRDKISDWVNEKNIQGFTPLHYASFNGHIDLIKYLESLGSNIHSHNYTKLNVMLMGAQNNKVSTLIHFKDRVSINEPDERGSTPLHWAAYKGNEDVVIYMLTLPQINLNIRDYAGQTPLMIATIYGQTRIVRRLLMKGANRNIKDNKDQLPMDIALQNDYKNITKMLNDDYSCMDLFKFYYNVKLQYKPKSRSLQIPIVFILSTFCALLIVNGLLLLEEVWMYVLQGIVIGFMLIFYLTLLQRVKTEPKGDIAKYIYDTKKICLECVRRKPKRSYHCQICKTCIEQYDHHCTWINNCVGKHNIGRFIAFLFLLVCSFGLIGCISGWALWCQIFQKYDTLSGWMAFRTQTDDPLHHIGKIVLLIANIVICMFVFPVFMLLLVQLKNLCLNKTTYERIRGDGYVKEQLKSKNKSQLSFQNCKTMCSKTKQSFSSTRSSSIDEELLSN